MHLRALVPIVLCTLAIWPLRALACINSMDTSAIVFSQSTIWLDLLLWTAGALFMNSVVLVNVRSPAAADQPRPSWFRRIFFLLVGACLVLLLAAVSAGGPLLTLSARDMSRCAMNGSALMVLMIGPAVLFALQAVIFQGLRQRVFGSRRGAALVGLVVTSVLLVLVVGVARNEIILPELCEPIPRPYYY